MKLTLCCITLTLLLGILLGASLGVFFREDILEERWTGGSKEKGRIVYHFASCLANKGEGGGGG
jgi:hypothetical protein